MQTLNNLKDRGQSGLNRLVEVGNQQPAEVKLWGATAGAAIVGGIAVAAVSKAVVALVITLAAPPVALTLGAVAGGVLGWSFMQSEEAKHGAQAPTEETVAQSAAPSETAPA